MSSLLAGQPDLPKNDFLKESILFRAIQVAVGI